MALRLDEHRAQPGRVEVQVVLVRLLTAQVRREALAQVEHCLHHLLWLFHVGRPSPTRLGGGGRPARFRCRVGGLSQLGLLQRDGLCEDGVVAVGEELPREQQRDAHDVDDEAEERDGHHVAPAGGVTAEARAGATAQP